MTPLQTPLTQAAYDHVKTAADMLEHRLNDGAIDADGLAARSHLIEAMHALDTVLAREAGQRGLEL